LRTNRGKLVRSLAAKFDPATLASLATVTLALLATTDELCAMAPQSRSKARGPAS
jgi:hypothetical protein